MTLPDLLLALVLILLADKLAGEGMERLGQTAVLGELLAGVPRSGDHSRHSIRPNPPPMGWAHAGPGTPHRLCASFLSAPRPHLRANRSCHDHGAFAAGPVLARTDRRAHIDELTKPVADFFVPIFFVTVGMQVDPATLNPSGEATRAVFWFTLLLTMVAVVSKLAAGLAVYQKGVRRWPVGVGMIPRGEVGLIFAGLRLSSGVIDQGLYAACVGMVMATTVMTPLWLQALYRTRKG